jgi:hypothetical protein
MSYIIPEKAYQVIKWAVLIVLPAVATLVSTVGPVWGMDSELCKAVTTTITAASAFGGVVLGVSAATAKPVDGGDADA